MMGLQVCEFILELGVVTSNNDMCVGFILSNSLHLQPVTNYLHTWM
jgi:hypothetical protein